MVAMTTAVHVSLKSHSRSCWQIWLPLQQGLPYAHDLLYVSTSGTGTTRRFDALSIRQNRRGYRARDAATYRRARAVRASYREERLEGIFTPRSWRADVASASFTHVANKIVSAFAATVLVVPKAQKDHVDGVNRILENPNAVVSRKSVDS